jgi:hypothetical protein
MGIIEAFVAFDTAKLRNAVAIAEAGRAGEVRFLGEIENTGVACDSACNFDPALPHHECYRRSSC